MKNTTSLFVVMFLLAGTFVWANKSVDQLPAVGSPFGTDLYYCVQSSTDYKCALDDIRQWSNVSITGGALDGVVIGERTPSTIVVIKLDVDADTIRIRTPRTIASPSEACL